MGIDIDSYRCRIGCFISKRGGDGIVTIKVDEDGMIRMVGQVWFIAMLLVMYGVERNPGPVDKVFTYRYQYLLIEVGTDVLRNLFNYIVGADFKTYLDNQPNEKASFRRLLGTNALTPDQRQLLPPINNSPSSDKFDISLLYCLLRNTCGLRVFTDQVWLNPQSTDTSVEACITRLKRARNDLLHSGSVFEDEAILTTKWTELRDILNELSKYCGYTNIASSIQTAETVDIDENLKGRFDKELKVWEEMEQMIDHGLGELIRGQANMTQHIAQGFQSISADLQEIKQRLEHTEPPLKNVDESGIQKRLVSKYEEDFSTLPLCPLHELEKGQMLNLYKIPKMQVIDYHKIDKPQSVKHIITCNDLFHNKEKECTNVYLTGDAGIGKTSFCKFIALMWSKSRLDMKLENGAMQKYVDYLSKFGFVFYINLRDTKRIDMIAMIVDQLFYTESGDEWSRVYRVVDEILNHYDSLIIMDGLDEWTPKPKDKRVYELPVRNQYPKCVYLTACRPYKIGNEILSRSDLDHHVQMTGLDNEAVKSYVENLINFTNNKYGENKNLDDFMKTVTQVNLSTMLHIPIITSHLFMLWNDRPLTSMSKSLVYGNIMDMFFKLAKERKIDFPNLTSTKSKFPEPLSSLKHLEKHFSQIEKLCLLSYIILFELEVDITGLVFTREQLASEPYNLCETETKFFCAIGILSKNNVMRTFGKQEYKLSFFHKSYLEFFAAMYVSTNETSNVFKKCTTINDVLKFKHFLIFCSGLSTTEYFVSLVKQMYSMISADLELCRAMTIFHPSWRDSMCSEKQLGSLTDMIFKCYEGLFQCDNPLPLEDFNFERHSDINEIRCKTLIKFLVWNGINVKYLHSNTYSYHDAFDNITNLQLLRINYVDSYSGMCIEKFTKMMVQNKSSLHTICIEGVCTQKCVLPVSAASAIKNLHNLTALSICNVDIASDVLQGILNSLSNKIHLKHFKLCYTIDGPYNPKMRVSLRLNSNHLISLYLFNVDIKISKINTSSLEYIKVLLNGDYDELYKQLQYASQLKYVEIVGDCWQLINLLNSTILNIIQHQSKIRRIEMTRSRVLCYCNLLLHPDVQQVDIRLRDVSMNNNVFKSFIKSCSCSCTKHLHINFVLSYCYIQFDGREGHLGYGESLEYMLDFIKPMPTVYNILKYNETIEFSIKTTASK